MSVFFNSMLLKPGRLIEPSPVYVMPVSSGVYLWLDANDPLNNGTRYTSPVALPTWYDKSSSVTNATQASAGAQPLYIPNAYNGNPAIRGNIAALKFYNLVSLANSSDITIMMVCTPGDSSNQYLYGSTGAGSSPAFITNFAASYEYYNINVTRITFAASASGLNALSYVKNGSTSSAYFNNNFVGTPGNTAPVSGLTTARLFQANNGGNSCGADICEFLLWNRPLDGTELNSMSSYFQTKWGTP